MNERRVVHATLGLFLALGAACAGGWSATRGLDGAAQGAEAIHRAKQGDEKITEYDLNRDRRPDVWDFTTPGQDADGRPIERHVRKEMDVNWDSRVDLAYEYDENERVARAVFDLDFDGKVDQVNRYEKGILVRKERDLDYNGDADLWIYFEKGKLVRKERDTNADGRVDYWEYWENDQIDRVGEDLDGDGKVDRWTRNSQSKAG